MFNGILKLGSRGNFNTSSGVSAGVGGGGNTVDPPPVSGNITGEFVSFRHLASDVSPMASLTFSGGAQMRSDRFSNSWRFN